MSTIRCMYEKEPHFPATDQHPAAVRYQVAGYWVDAIGGMPTQSEIEALLTPPALPITAEELLAAMTVKGGIPSRAEVLAERGK